MLWKRHFPPPFLLHYSVQMSIHWERKITILVLQWTLFWPCRSPISGDTASLWYIAWYKHLRWCQARNKCSINCNWNHAFFGFLSIIFFFLSWMNLVLHQWSKLERGKQTLYINAYVWHLEKWSWWTYLLGRNRDTDVENGLVDTARERKGGTDWRGALKCIQHHVENS